MPTNPTPEQVREIAAGLIRLIPEATKTLIRASTGEWELSGTIAKRAGLRGGYAAVNVFKTAGFHEQYWPVGGQQILWRLNDLGLAVRTHLEHQHG